jgi:hypothetical protein
MATKDQVAQLIVAAAKQHGHTRDECLAEMSALYQESGWDETVWDKTHTTYGIAQQDGSYLNRFDGAAAQIDAFFGRLDVKRVAPGRGDIWLNLCWLQQAPNWPSAQYWYDHGRRAYLTEIKSRVSTVTPYLDKYWPSGGTVTDSRPDFNEVDQLGWDAADPHGSVRSRPPINFFLHTQEGGGGDSAATDLAAYLRSTKGDKAVSYHYTIRQAADGGVTVVDVIDTDLYSWAVLQATNVFSINLCYAGSKAAWSRAEWMTQSKAIRVSAYLAVQDARKYGFSTEVIAPPYGAARPGISDHKYVTQVIGDGTHTDVGNNFPWDYFTQCVAEFVNADTPGAQPPPAVIVPTPPAERVWPRDYSDRELLEYVAAQLGPGDPTWASKGSTLRDKVWDLS